MKRYFLYLLLSLVAFAACDLRIQRVSEYKPEGPGVNYRINDCVGGKVKYLTGARWITAAEPSCVLSAWDERDKTLWNALYAPGHIRSGVGLEVAVFPTRMSSRERIFVLIQAVDTAGQNMLILAEYDSFGVRRYEKPVIISKTPVSGKLLADYDRSQVYVAGCLDETDGVQTFFMFRFRPETRGTWTRKYQDPSLRLNGVHWIRARDRGFIAAGVLNDQGDAGYVRFDSIGGYKNLVRYETPERESAVADVDVDYEGNIGLTAVSQDPKNGAAYLTLVYGDNDRLRWSRRCEGAVKDGAARLVLAGDASAYLSSASTEAGGRAAIKVVSYDREGGERWTRWAAGKDGEAVRPFAVNFQYPQPGYVGKEVESDLYLAAGSGRDALVLQYNRSGVMKGARFGRRGQTMEPVGINDRYLTVNYTEGEKSGAYLVHFGPFEIPGIRRWD